VDNTYDLKETVVKPSHGWTNDKVAIIEVEGMLSDTRSGGFLQPQENPVSLFVQQMDQAADDDAVKAVVLRVNSPGGTVTASDLMYQVVKRFKAKTHKIVVASIQEVGASGAYYVSCASDKIVAQDSSIVGSIGVIFETVDVTDTMSKLGIRSETIKDEKGVLKDMGSPFHHMTDLERQTMQSMIQEDYSQFENIVTSNRPPLNVAAVTTGQVFTGRDALKLGLIDQTGILEDAIDVAKDMSHAPNAAVVMYKRPYGYEGSIYASSKLPVPHDQSPTQPFNVNLNVPGLSDPLPTGFYYLATGW
jgi:protease-4